MITFKNIVATTFPNKTPKEIREIIKGQYKISAIVENGIYKGLDISKEERGEE